LIINIGAISANEINDDTNILNNRTENILSSVSDSDNNSNIISSASSDVEDSLSSDNCLQASENSSLSSVNDEEVLNSVVKNNTSLTVKNSVIIKGDYLEVYLKNNKGNVIVGENLTFNIFGKNYTKTTDSNGIAKLQINTYLTNYTLNVSYLGNTVYSSSSKTLTISSKSKLDTSSVVKNSTIVKGKYVEVYLVDENGNPIKNQNVTFNIFNKNYTKLTNSLGVASLKLNANLGTYTIKVSYKGAKNYSSNSKSINIDIVGYGIIIKNSTVNKGSYLYAYLTDENGNALKNKNITFTLFGKDYVKTTDSAGKVGLQLNLYPYKYSIIVAYAGDNNHSALNKTVNTKVVSSTNLKAVSTTILKGNSLNICLKDNTGSVLSGKKVIFTIFGKNYTKTTNSSGIASLKLNADPGKYSIGVTFSGNSYFLTSKITPSIIIRDTSKITVSNTVVSNGTYFNVYLKSGSSKVLSNKNITITISNKTYTKTTDSCGKASLLINLNKGNYPVTIKFAGDTYYVSSSKTMTLNVTAITAIISASSTTVGVNSSNYGKYSIKLTDINGNVLSGKNITVTVTSNNYCTGTGNKITAKTIVLDSDNIYNKTKDTALLNQMASLLRAKGYNVIVSGIGPNYHVTDVYNYEDVCVFTLVGGLCSGTFLDMSTKYYQNYLSKYNNTVVLGCLAPPNTRDLATATWLEKAYDDDFSQKIIANFTGLSYPGTFLNKNVSIDYVYGSTAKELVSNFLNYAINGKSIGLNGTIPKNITTTYTLTTNSNGIATLSNLRAGSYTIVSSYSDVAGGYVANTVKTTVTVK